MKKLALILALVLIPALVVAGSATVQWNADTTYTDGSAFPLADVGAYVIYHDVMSAVSKTTSNQIVLPISASFPSQSVMQYTVISIPTGTHWFSVCVRDKYYPQNPESALSAPVAGWAKAQPSTITVLTVVSGLVAL